MPDPTLIAAATAAAQQYGVPVDLFIAQIQQESSFNPSPPANPSWLPSAGGPVGIAQFTQATAQQYGLDPTDPIASLTAAAKYDAALFGQYGNWSSVLQHYGTIPSSGTLTPSQQNLANMAAGLGGSNPSQGQGGNPLLTQVGFPGLGSLGNAFSNIGTWFWDLFMRIVVILAGLILIWEGLAMMRGGTTITENVVVSSKDAGRRVDSKIGNAMGRKSAA